MSEFIALRIFRNITERWIFEMSEKELRAEAEFARSESNVFIMQALWHQLYIFLTFWATLIKIHFLD